MTIVLWAATTVAVIIGVMLLTMVVDFMFFGD